MKTPGVYVIAHVASGRTYVGSSCDVVGRLARHRQLLTVNRHHNSRLQRSWLKYGEEAFSFSIVEMLSGVDRLIEREQAWLDRFWPHVFNHGTCIGAVCRGLKLSAAVKARISRAMKGKPHTPEHTARAADGHRGKPRPAAHIARLAAAARAVNRGRPKSEAHRAAIAAALTGLPKDSDHADKSRASLASARKWITKESRARAREAMKGQVRTPEQRARISAGRMGHKNFAGKKHSPETIARMRATHLANHARKRAAAA